MRVEPLAPLHEEVSLLRYFTSGPQLPLPRQGAALTAGFSRAMSLLSSAGGKLNWSFFLFFLVEEEQVSPLLTPRLTLPG